MLMLCRPTIGYNVLALGEEADFEVLNCLLALNLIRSTKLDLTTEPAFLPNACYAFALLFLSSVLLSFLVGFVVRWQSKLFCNFWPVRWLVRIANVLAFRVGFPLVL
jgi:hypothetical protein